MLQNKPGIGWKRYKWSKINYGWLIVEAWWWSSGRIFLFLYSLLFYVVEVFIMKTLIKLKDICLHIFQTLGKKNKLQHNMILFSLPVGSTFFNPLILHEHHLINQMIPKKTQNDINCGPSYFYWITLSSNFLIDFTKQNQKFRENS